MPALSSRALLIIPIGLRLLVVPSIGAGSIIDHWGAFLASAASTPWPFWGSKLVASDQLRGDLFRDLFQGCRVLPAFFCVH
jgi:hypothetical protein